MKLSEEARAEIRKATASNDTSQLHTVFVRAQLDALQHIRNYWVPRFVLHQEFVAMQRCSFTLCTIRTKSERNNLDLRIINLIMIT